MKSRSLTFFAIVLGLLMGIGGVSCRKPAQQTQENTETTFVVPVTLPRYQTLVKWFPVTTRLRAPVVPVLPTVAGRFQRFTVSEGAWVKKDQVVALLDRSMPGVRFQEAKVLAPATGRIHLLDLDPGMPVSPTTPLAQIYESGPLKFTLYLPEVYHGVLKPGDRVPVVAGSDTLWARIFRRTPGIDPRLGAREVIGQLETRELVAGQTVRVLVPVVRRDHALTLPAEAVQGEVQKFVFVVHGNRAHKVPVTVGISTLETVEILQGITEHDTVIALPVANLKEGAPVKVVW